MSRFSVQPPAGLVGHTVAGSGDDLAEGTYLWDGLLTKLQQVDPLSLSPAAGGGLSRGSGWLLRGFGPAASTGYAYELWGVVREYASTTDRNKAARDTPKSAYLIQLASGTLTTGAAAEPADSAARSDGTERYPHASATLAVGATMTTIAAALGVSEPSKAATGLIIVPDMGVCTDLIIESAAGLKWLATRFG